MNEMTLITLWSFLLKNPWIIYVIFIILLSIIVLAFSKINKLNTLLRSHKEHPENKDPLDSQNILKSIVDNLPDFIYVKDKESKFVFAGKKLLKTVGLNNTEDILGKTDHDFYPEDLADEFLATEKKVIRSGEAIMDKIEENFDEHNNPIWVNTSIIPLRNSKNKLVGIVGIGRDITKKKNFEEELKEKTVALNEANILLEERQEEISQQQEELKTQNEILDQERSMLRNLIDSMPDRIYLKDRNSRFIIGNNHVAGIMGVQNSGQIIGKTDFDFYPGNLAKVYYDDEQRILADKKAIINKEEAGLDMDGRQIIVSTTKVPFFDEKGVVAGIVGIGRDITPQKNVEKELNEKSMVLQEVNLLLVEKQEEIIQQADILKLQSEQLQVLNATKDVIFSIIGHDLKNPLHSILGFSDLLLKNTLQIEEDKKKEFLQMIKEASLNAYSLLENLLNWARSQSSKLQFNPVILNINEVIKENIPFVLGNAETKKIKLSTPDKTPNPVLADRDMLNVIFRNLLSNAIKFTNLNGNVMISTTELKGRLIISIVDDGVGIKDEDKEKLFRIDSFHTSHGTSGEIGTGLGLIVCKDFIERHRGELQIESTPGHGSTFSFSLPLAKK